MRTFIAVEISDEISNALAQLEARLKYAGADVKWVRPENIHLTLKFLGEISEEKAKEVIAALDGIAKSAKSFELSVKEVGAFPKVDYPRVIWVGLEKGADESSELAAKVEDALAKIGFPKESRPFTAHLTIGRVRSSKNKDKLKEKILGKDSSQLLPVSSHKVSSVILFQSTLTPSGSIYTKLHESKFPL